MPTPRFFATLIALLIIAPLAQAEQNATQERGRYPEKMVVTVVDEAGNPITNANGFHRFGRFVYYDVDENGIFEITMDEVERWQTRDFTVWAEGFGPFLAGFSEDPIIPDTFTAVLKPAQRIGGILRRKVF